MGFEVFDRDQTEGPVAVPSVKIDSSGGILLSRAARALMDRIRPNATIVELLYDRDTRRVAIRPLNSNTPGSKRFAVRTLRTKEWPVVVDAREFSEFWKLPMGRGQLFSIAQLALDKTQALVFDLREANGETMA